MIFLFVLSFISCVSTSIDCENTADYVNEDYVIFLGAQNSSSPRAIALELQPEQVGSLMNGYFLEHLIYFFQDYPSELAIYLSDSKPDSSQLDNFTTEIDFQEAELDKLGVLVGYYQSDTGGYSYDNLLLNGNIFIETNYLESSKYITYVVPSGVSAQVELDITLTHCESDNNNELERNSEFFLDEEWTY